MFVWTLSDVLYTTVGLLLITGWVVISVANWFRQFRCKHDGRINETQSCSAICSKCGKNLGFIDSWRKTWKSK